MYLDKPAVAERPKKPTLRNDLKYAPLAQLVEHLTLNQGVPGSSP